MNSRTPWEAVAAHSHEEWRDILEDGEEDGGGRKGAGTGEGYHSQRWAQPEPDEEEDAHTKRVRQ